MGCTSAIPSYRPFLVQGQKDCEFALDMALYDGHAASSSVDVEQDCLEASNALLHLQTTHMASIAV